jgi:hypothetical protein
MLKTQIKKLRREGHSYSEISKKTNKSKKFVWRASKDIKFSKKGKKRYHREVKGIPKMIKPQPSKLSPQKVRIIGHLLFDGAVWKGENYNRTIMYVNSSNDLVVQLINDVYKIYGLKPTFIEEKLNYKKVIFKSKLMFNDLINYFKSYSTSDENIRIPSIIMQGDKKIKIEFLKSFWEDEGSISAIGRLTGDSKSYNIIHQLKVLMEQFGFDLRICKYSQYTGYMYKIYLLKKRRI